jgi:cyclic pyranopterin phosphate synthase
MSRKLSHLDDEGRPHMVNVGEKATTARRAVARGALVTGSDIMRRLADGNTPKGNVYEIARIAGIQGAKRTSELVPLCHPLPLDHVDVRLTPAADRILIEAEASCEGRTGVEMEAMTAVSVAALTLYDMLKAWSHDLEIADIVLVEKTGGRSGTYRRDGT